MASASGRRTSSSNSNRNSARKSNTRRKSTAARQARRDYELFHEIGLIIFLVAMILLFLCNFGIIGVVGDAISGVMFGIFGLTAYIAPPVLFLAAVFWFANAGSPTALRKILSGVVLFLMAGVICQLVTGDAASLDGYDITYIFNFCKSNKKGGGVLAGSLTYLLYHYLEMIGTVLVVMLLSAVSLILLTEKSLLGNVREKGSKLRERTREDSRRRKEYAELRKQEQEEARLKRTEERQRRAEEKENEKILRMDKKVSGVMIDTALSHSGTEKARDDIHEITFGHSDETPEAVTMTDQDPVPAFDFEKINIRMAKPSIYDEPSDEMQADTVEPLQKAASDSYAVDIQKEIQSAEKKIPSKYIFPPLSRLNKIYGKKGDSTKELKETAQRLQQTLNTFGVRVTITDISQGPSVTRYELQPEQGVKVSKIVGLADDIKLNLAATDIRIEAPIPGKAAVGIEVPNKENMAVALRDLLESKEFKDYSSNLTFAVGKDIAGQVVVADIAKMPHMLIAGSTGSGKSVCINTLIMSILYKAHPDDVKLIMVDPKVVELSVYNGIPHLMIPVVTDPKQAAAALHWGVDEMQKRYKKFADFNVRDLKGYNKKIMSMKDDGQDASLVKMPQIVIIVDELADLMMVSPGEVEESICRLAQLARAAGIHLIIATQRPSVDVITGLIKANMPSRVAFSVSSGVDSRTILDMNGAEKLLGKGDMLFYPQGYAKPVRIQGAFVSDKEVSDVVDFLKNQALGNTYAEEIEEQIKSIGTMSGTGGSGDGGDSRDEYFAQAGKFIIEKDKASIGMLQRMFKIGFNRAARIMDQLGGCGVVGEEEGTKPRKVLMSMEQFEQLLEEI